MNRHTHTPQRQPLLSRYFAFLERRSLGDRWLFHMVLAVCITAAIWSFIELSNRYLTETPVAGGMLIEGVVGTPRFVNPVLAVTRADQDMVALVYDGLMKIDAEGNLVPDLAESVTLSDDGRIYTITLKRDIYFHNGNPLTARDVLFTIGLIQNPELKSPLRGNWDGVTATEVGEHELTLTLGEPYTPFIENLTVGILPRSVWDALPIEQLPFSQYNTEPIGTGSFAVKEVMRDDAGLINAYVLTAAPYGSEQPNMHQVMLRFYQNEAALAEGLTKGEIDGTPSLSPESLATITTDDYQVSEHPLPRTFGVFFNQNRSAALLDPAVREALEIMIDRDALVDRVTDGHSIPTASPVPPGFITVQSSSTEPYAAANLDERIAAATQLLTSAGWQKNDAALWQKTVDDETVTLSLTISTSNTPLFDATATVVTEWWQALGVEVSVNQYEQTDLVQAIIRPRNYQVLLFGSDIGRALDLYPFWHSSQKDDPGLNITQYTNIEADTYLKTIRTAKTATERDQAIIALMGLIAKERPAIFLFTPTFTYLTSPDVTHPSLNRLSSPSDRFANIHEWYTSKERLWPIFQN
jgi:peptide/nickel transport system substrate-binding protein